MNHTRFPGRKKIPDRHLEDKIKYIRDCHNTLRALSPYKNEGLAIIDRVEATSEDRHFFAHGYAQSVTAEEYPDQIWKVVHDPQLHGTEVRSLDLDQMEKIVGIMSEIAFDLAHYIKDKLLPLTLNKGN